MVHWRIALFSHIKLCESLVTVLCLFLNNNFTLMWAFSTLQFYSCLLGSQEELAKRRGVPWVAWMQDQNLQAFCWALSHVQQDRDREFIPIMSVCGCATVGFFSVLINPWRWQCRYWNPTGAGTFGGYKPRPMLPTGNISEADNVSFSSLGSDLQQKQDPEGERDYSLLLWAETASAEIPSAAGSAARDPKLCRHCSGVHETRGRTGPSFCCTVIIL